MYVAIDRDHMKVIATGDHRVLGLLVYIENPDVAVVLAPADAGGTYSRFTDMELRVLYRNLTGYSYEGSNYNALLQACRTAVMKIEPADRSLAQLEAQAAKIPFTSTKPQKAVAGPAPAGQAEALAKAPTPATSPVTGQAGSPSAPNARPKPGTATGRVWDIADETAAAMPEADPKALRAEIVKRCAAEGINPATAQVQYGKWKGSKN